jgi:hypothetical protein
MSCVPPTRAGAGIARPSRYSRGRPAREGRRRGGVATSLRARRAPHARGLALFAPRAARLAREGCEIAYPHPHIASFI